jgi:hypothetical protein
MNAQNIAAGACAISFFLGACSAPPARTDSAAAPKPALVAAPGSAAREVKSRDGSFSGQIIGTPAPGSKFALLQIGMRNTEVGAIVGRYPDQAHDYESGKRWIPFYFGDDARRTQVLYRGEGCLIFTAGGARIWNSGGGGTLVQIEVDPTGTCYVP